MGVYLLVACGTPSGAAVVGRGIDYSQPPNRYLSSILDMSKSHRTRYLRLLFCFLA